MATSRTSTGTSSTRPSAGRSGSPRSGERRPRRRADPARKMLVGAVVMVLFGSFLPWVGTAAGTVSGARGAGLWTFYAAMLGLGAALVPLRRLAAAQAALFGLIAMALPVWQVVHLLTLVGASGWMPGPGLVLVFAGGVLSATAAWRLLRGSPPAG
ncbi:hypothetical protein [Nocardioides sp.]|uniref:hypothetical protein n=1 Tax=Nocardioides sp. TaxID=35761 RepID=UPI00273506AE|nr:hypothetical protein [Nocardioides sp.]MDP3890451.1 hypothetical protein [Nocardioides sp.]